MRDSAPLVLDPEAEEEIEEAVSWYQREAPGHGRRFLDALETVFERIRFNPGQFPQIPRAGSEFSLRRALLDRYPYSVVFLVWQEGIRVVAVVHSSRRPGYWLTRVESE